MQVSVVAKQRQSMLDRLATPEGKRLYALRQQIAEPTIGNIKSNMKLGRFLLDGKAGASSETWLMCMAHNLKIYAKRAAKDAKSLLRVFLAGGTGAQSRNVCNLEGLRRCRLCCST